MVPERWMDYIIAVRVPIVSSVRAAKDGKWPLFDDLVCNGIKPFIRHRYAVAFHVVKNGTVFRGINVPKHSVKLHIRPKVPSHFVNSTMVLIFGSCIHCQSS
jgi:hypothetical protein